MLFWDGIHIRWPENAWENRKTIDLGPNWRLKSSKVLQGLQHPYGGSRMDSNSSNPIFWLRGLFSGSTYVGIFYVYLLVWMFTSRKSRLIHRPRLQNPIRILVRPGISSNHSLPLSSQNLSTCDSQPKNAFIPFKTCRILSPASVYTPLVTIQLGVGGTFDFGFFYFRIHVGSRLWSNHFHYI